MPDRAGEVELTVVVMALPGRRSRAPASPSWPSTSCWPGATPAAATSTWWPRSTHPGRLLVIQKWESPEAQRAHFDSADMVEMAEACRGLLAEPPDIDLLEAISAHDLA